jgi:hypothetical protein
MMGIHPMPSRYRQVQFDPDGAVLLGIKLLEAQWEREDAQRVPAYQWSAASLISAHEHSHILQYKMGYSPNGPWQMEPHADFMAGWCIGQDPVLKKRENIENVVQAVFEVGDIKFNDSSHHGEPEFRAAMVQAGYDASRLKLQAAFAKGKKMAGLKS